MIAGMSKQPAKKPKRDKESVPVVYLRLDDDTDTALRAYIAAQEVPPDRAAVGMTALRQFLAKHGVYPPKKSEK